MSLHLRWVGYDHSDAIALVRARCYGGADKDLPKFQESLRDDRRVVDGDILLAERDGRAIGTATCLSLAMWVRGGRLPCQGVAWVGTIKTHRRSSGSKGDGVASRIMREALRKARERGQAVSALMPFRGSFYEHFGYGIVERRCNWTIPMSILPAGEFEGVGFLEPADKPALAACRQRQVERGQCDIERSPAGWDLYLMDWADGLTAVDRAADGSIRGYLAFEHLHKDGKNTVQITEAGYDDTNALRRLLHFLASLRDQYSTAAIALPSDLPLNLLLRESQLPHRPVSHAYAEVQPVTRMQLRVLDHKRLIEAMRFREDVAGRAVVAVKECEGTESRFAVDISGGHAGVSATEASADFRCDDCVWAQVVCGVVKATTAIQLGLAEGANARAAAAIDLFSEGPAAFSQEYF